MNQDVSQLNDCCQVMKCKWNNESQIYKKYEIISKTCEDFSKNKKIINIHNNLFQKICCLLIIKTENDHNLRSRLFKFLKLSALIFFFVN